VIDRSGQAWVGSDRYILLVLSTRHGRVSDVLKDHPDDHTILHGFAEHEAIDLAEGTLVSVRENQEFPWETRDYWERVS